MANRQEIPVRLNMASIISYDGITDDPMQVRTNGVLIPRKGAMILRYLENLEDEETGQTEESEIELLLNKDLVTMNRKGDFANTMMFRKNTRFETVFHTPYGDLPMAIHTRDMRCDLGQKRGRVHLKYELSMQGAYASTNELDLEYMAR